MKQSIFTNLCRMGCDEPSVVEPLHGLYSFAPVALWFDTKDLCHRASDNRRPWQKPRRIQAISWRLRGSPSHALISQPPPSSTMTSTSQRPEGRDRVLPTLDVFIQILSIAKDTCGIPPAQIAFGSAGALLAMIRARFPFMCKYSLLTRIPLGYDGQQSGFRRPRPGLR